METWGRTHHRRITNLLMTGNLIVQWNSQRLVYALVMLSGVASFFLGLICFIIDTQPIAVWVTILVASLISYSLIQAVKMVSSRRFLHFGTDPRRSFLQRIFSTPDYFAEGERSRDIMGRRQQAVAVMYKFCSDQRFV